jgi:hypothetical protein
MRRGKTVELKREEYGWRCMRVKRVCLRGVEMGEGPSVRLRTTTQGSSILVLADHPVPNVHGRLQTGKKEKGKRNKTHIPLDNLSTS